MFNRLILKQILKSLVLLIIFYVYLSPCSYAQEVILPQKLVFRNHIYNSNIKSVQCYRLGFEQSTPVIDLNSNDQISLKFDNMRGLTKVYKVMFVHCSANWAPSPLDPFEYLDGFDSDDITNIASSYNTFHDYTHYQYNFPNDQIKFSRSGNYLLIVYDENLDNLILTQRIKIYTANTIIQGDIGKPNIPKYAYFNQAIELDISLLNYNINNPSDITLVIEQNDRWDKSISNLKPSFVRNNVYSYRHQDNNHFPGGKEFRAIDLRDINFKSERIHDIILDNPNKIILKVDEFRSFIHKMEWRDLNGQFAINNNMQNSDTESEYNEVYFKLQPGHNMEYPDADIYLFGAFNNWEISEEHKMSYNLNNKMYENTLLLKQGVYNYYYAYVSRQDSIVNTSLIEGDSKDTENDYHIYVYVKPLGEIHDELIGYSILNSIKN